MKTYGPIESTASRLPDARLRRRLGRMIDTFVRSPGLTIPAAMGDRNAMDAAYAFFANMQRVSPEAIVAEQVPALVEQVRSLGRVLIVHDTTEFHYAHHPATRGLGHLDDGHAGRGFKCHSSLVLDDTGVPLGVLHQQYWVRDLAERGKNRARKRRPATDKESYRWQDGAAACEARLPECVACLHVADREGDLFAWFAASRRANAELLVRASQPHRLVVAAEVPEAQEEPLANVIARQPSAGSRCLHLPRSETTAARDAVVAIRIVRVLLRPPQNTRQRSAVPPVPVWVIEAAETSPPPGVEPIRWTLVTTQAVADLDAALEMLKMYRWRWRIEQFHYTWKSGWKIEELELETADRLANAAAVFAQVAVRVLRLTYLAREEPDRPVEVELSADEQTVLAGMARRNGGRGIGTLKEAVRAIARLGGFLGRKLDGEPGVKVVWRGLRRLNELVAGYRFATQELERYP
jgi:hypothetical protein